MSDLTAWARDHYDALKDFAGPVGTIIASLAAAVVAYTLGRSQRRISELQAAVADKTWRAANDKIVLELVEARIAIFEAISAVVAKSHIGKPKPYELYFEFSHAAARAPFYFGDDVLSYLEKLRNLIIEIEETNEIMSDTSNHGYLSAVRQRPLQMKEISKFYSEAPAVFRPYIQVQQRAQH